ncbi:MobF family relaxase [Acetobacter vaccinii]|uniref:Relaxase domain-containing protein n=1 Tax=Acetobacter vaccinii TaxID=2592655 RepID=A0A5C1YUA3_9PROT|nr:MobF family relaxase [Acetobacter vaccinii]QEO18767.1 relaxase domain-containing protein [Acetobacter vaccinii]
MITYRKLSANGVGRLLVAYMREHQLRPGPVGDHTASQTAEAGGRLNSYFTGRDGQGSWAPDIGPLIADALGLDISRPPTDEELIRLFECKRASDGADWPGAHANRTISGIDFTASPDKSVTLAAEFAATTAEQALIWHAIQQANDRALALIGREIGVARRGQGGQGEHEAGEVAWVSFRHYTARPAMHIQDGLNGPTASVEIPVPGDPQAHIHNAVFNAVATEDGHLGSLDTARVTKMTSHLFGAYFQAELGQQLRSMGVRVRPDERGRAIVIEAIPRDVCEAFSKRSRQAEQQAKAFVKRQGGNWDTLSAEQKFKVLHQANLAYRSKKYDGTNDREIWREEARALGWSHRSVLEDVVAAPTDPGQRYEQACAIASRLLAEEFETQAVIDRDAFRMHAAHGLIATGLDGPQDIDRVAEMILERGIEIRGERVHFLQGVAHGRVQVTTSEQIRVEQEMGRLAGLSARTRAGSLEDAAIARVIAASSLDFEREPDHGRAQKAAIFALGRAGGLGFLTGVAGAGKTALLAPLVSAWKEDGRQVIGAAVAWRQADALRDTGISQSFALAKLLRDIETGEHGLTRQTVLVLDEVSQIGPRQMLRLLELQETIGFSMRLLGDREQAQAIEAGDSLAILKRVLPAEAAPELLSTIRQASARGRAIAGLFRSQGRDPALSEAEQREKDAERAREAIAMKCRDGTFRLIGGDHDQVVDEIADFYLRRRDMLTAAGSRRGITMSAPTNEDVMALSMAVRSRLRARGEIGEAEIIRPAIDQRGEVYDLPLSVGDRVRLFDRVQVRVQTPRGLRWRHLGSNGDIVSVAGWDEAGLRLTNSRGLEGLVPWERLADQTSGRTRLGFGHAMTIDAAQGITSDEHINAMPRGTATMTGFTAYVAESRHVQTCWTRIAEAPVREAEQFSRPLGDTTPVTHADLLDRIAADLGRHPYKPVGIDLMKRRLAFEAETARWIRQSHTAEAMVQAGQSPGGGWRARKATQGLRAIPGTCWDDISRTMRKRAYETQNVAERISRLVEEQLRSREAEGQGEAAQVKTERERTHRRSPSVSPGQ